MSSGDARSSGAENHLLPSRCTDGALCNVCGITDDVFQVTPGSLFPALRRLEENGWASGYWGPSENNRKARYYAITKEGQRQLAREKQHWKSITTAVEKVLEGA